MTTGLEALGAASAVLSVISFAGSLISLTYKIYDGQPPPQAELEGYVQQLLYAANRVQLRSERVPQITQTEKKLCEVAKECMRVTKALQQEISTITKQNRKGKFPRAIHMAFQAYKHRSKIKDLETSLRFCRETLETELLLNICDTSATIEQQQSEGFRDLKGNIQNLISQAAGGNTIIDGLITREAKVILDNISTQITVELEALYARTMSDSRCNRFLSSIKFVEMKKRCNEVTPSSDAFFDRVLIAYKRIHSESFDHNYCLKIGKISHADYDLGTSKSIIDEIDQQWYSFSSWLQSEDKLFWIRGKPASGKSTLINFIINNDATKRLLDSRSRNPDTRILSHFFWKIGSERQNSIKGLLSTLLYEILCEDRDMVPQVLERFDLSQHDSYDDWSAQDLEKVLFTVLQTLSRSTCIFIDGLDEVSDKDGFLKLMDIIQKLGSCQNLKVCVSSRPEIELENRLQKIGAQSLYLEKLTRPEMALYVHGQLGRYAENQIPTSRLKRFTVTLLDKAEGVFLWLILATKSLANGIENGDNEKTLSDRLQELPGELEALYEAMWARLNANNPVYRETAARYFRCITADGGHEGFSSKDSGMNRWTCVNEPTLVKVALVVNVENYQNFSTRAGYTSHAELDRLCEMTTKDIQIRCAGMLEIRPYPSYYDFPWEIQSLGRPVSFIHRTAHDFLMDTEAGQRILNYKNSASAMINQDINMMRSWLYLAKAFWRHGMVECVDTAAKNLLRLDHVGVDQNDVLELILTTREYCKFGVLGCSRRPWYPCPSLWSLLAWSLVNSNGFFESLLVQPELLCNATDGLRDIAADSIYPHKLGPPSRLIKKIVALGGDPHAIGLSSLSSRKSCKESLITQKSTAFELFLRGAMNQFLEGNLEALPGFLDIISIMAQTCRDWHRKVMIAPKEVYKHHRSRIVLVGCELFMPYDGQYIPWVACEVNLEFLLMRILAAADSHGIPTHVYKLQELSDCFKQPYACIRYIGPKQWSNEENFCYRILDQQPFQGLINHLFGCKESSDMTIYAAITAIESFNSSNSPSTLSMSRAESSSRIFEKVTLRAEIDNLVGIGSGLLKPQDLDIGTCSLKSRDEALRILSMYFLSLR